MFPPAAYVLIAIYAGVYGRPVVAMQDFNTLENCKTVAAMIRAEVGTNLSLLQCVRK